MKFANPFKKKIPVALEVKPAQPFNMNIDVALYNIENGIGYDDHAIKSKKIKNPFKKKTMATPEIKLPDMSIWENDVALYIETEAIAEKSNKFRIHYRKVTLCIMNSKTKMQVESCKKMYTLFRRTHNLYHQNSHSKTFVEDNQFVDTICGYLENLIQQQESKYSMTVVYDQIPNVAPMVKKIPNPKPKD